MAAGVGVDYSLDNAEELLVPLLAASHQGPEYLSTPRVQHDSVRVALDRAEDTPAEDVVGALLQKTHDVLGVPRVQQLPARLPRIDGELRSYVLASCNDGRPPLTRKLDETEVGAAAYPPGIMSA
jgi:hypothetical protein